MKKWTIALLLFVVVLVIESFIPRKITWVAIGDSITYLNEHPDEAGNRITEGYMSRVVKQLPELEYTNQGHNGWTACRIASSINELNLQPADLYSIFLGTNDWWAGLPIGTFSDYRNNTGNNTVYGAFRTIIDKLRSLNPKAQIVLITPLQRGDFVYFKDFNNNAYGSYKPKANQTLLQLVQAIDTIAAKERITKVDLYRKSGITVENAVKFKRLKDPVNWEYKNFTWPAYKDIPFDPQQEEYPYPLAAVDMTYDGLHPSDKGYEIIANMLIKAMKPLLKKIN
ncbi:SGNH/GDSL hydrolase family protein [Chitinophaga silvatica]|uniref:SGNH/GDSL hydrolase family protein n=1 Tax=Chitinophaga silvatica TaxID=2282649 RepID=A0A3E1Y614_9BACT|nr:SGNH/GDSL hydrolase family protein [Chitinophaga silvatica]RFS20179.1 SGNH/GDSL hydrolase family protein [Chitinophaga silvatica]